MVTIKVTGNDSDSHIIQCTNRVVLVDSFSTTGVSSSETTSSCPKGTKNVLGSVMGITTGVLQIFSGRNLMRVEHVFNHDNYTESLLSFLNFVNNKDGWSKNILTFV